MKNDPVATALASLDAAEPHSPAGREQLRKAVDSKYPLVTAKAARLAGDARLAELAEPLASAFVRLLSGNAKDKGCAALTALARALVNLDYDDGDLFRRGMKHVRMEAVWGGSHDVAAELRAACAMGLANSRDYRKLQALVELLADREPPARLGAVKALAVTGSDAASLLLRYKALTGDPDPDVLSECLAALLCLEGAEALPLVAGLAESRDAAVSEPALLALGASRRPEAVVWLQARLDQLADLDSKRLVILALAAARTEAAMECLLGIVRHASAGLAGIAVSALGATGPVLHAIAAREDAAAILRVRA